ncbi:metallophosphoesterase [Salinicola sp. MH3R3-1]|uniref:metallophosphoesterase n=1 Tax=Salinicola sp. MH3R3-1 TaxID=1928762 RepID=UPI000AD23022|nr:metallophosphoesterase [Salinicola sp. MH3R3-1]
MKITGHKSSRIRKWLTYALVGIVVLVLAGSAVGMVILKKHGYSIADYLPGTVAHQVPPYVQNVTRNSASILWDTTSQSDTSVNYGTTSHLGNTASGEPKRRHEVKLFGLKEDTLYYYRVEDDGPLDDIHTFRTAPGAEATVTFAALGDSGDASKAQYQMATIIAKSHPQLVLHLGDVVYKTGAERQYDSRFYLPYEGLLSSILFYPSLGNHDVRTNDGQPYLSAFDLPTNNPQQTERYYSFDYGPVHFVALDSELYAGDHSLSTEAQKTWLQKDLDQRQRPWTIIFFHRPPFSSSLGPHPGGDARICQDLVPIFERANVDLVLTGHQHNYERLEPINGVNYIVSGGGGADLYPIEPGKRSAYAVSRLNVLELKASPHELKVDAVGEDGAVFDSVRLTQ